MSGSLYGVTSFSELKAFEFLDLNSLRFNNHRTHTSMEGRTPNLSASQPIANLRSFRWEPHCRSLYQTPVAA